jgi:hypothetical protein
MDPGSSPGVTGCRRMPDRARHDPRSAPFRHSKRLTYVSFRTPYSRVIPNAVRTLQLGIRRKAMQNSRRFLVATLLGMIF